MINRANYLQTRSYLTYLEEVKQLASRSVERYWVHLKHLLRWADETPFGQVPSIRPTFATYLATARLDGGQEPLATATIKKVIQTTKRFFSWAQANYPKQYRKFTAAWIDELQPPRTIQRPEDHAFITLDQVQQLLALDPQGDLALWRDTAAAAMLFLSGMRSSAFGSLPIEAVDLNSWSVKQWPGLGVRTKNGKAATTYLLDIQDLREAVWAWDDFIRPQLPPSAAWYTPIISRWGEHQLSTDPPGRNRNHALIKRMRKLFAAAGVPYQSPHKFRHGHAVYALQHALDMADYKAISMNLMHSDIRVTDSIYAPLAQADVKQRIAGLVNGQPAAPTANGDLAAQFPNLSPADLALLNTLVGRLQR